MFTAAELAAFQDAQDLHMMDTCILVQRKATATVDAYGHAVYGTTRTTSICGLDLRASHEVENAEARWYDARMRLPIATDISNIVHIIVTHRHGEAVDPLRYTVSGDARRGPSGLLLDLRSDTNA